MLGTLNKLQKWSYLLWGYLHFKFLTRYPRYHHVDQPNNATSDTTVNGTETSSA